MTCLFSFRISIICFGILYLSSIFQSLQAQTLLPQVIKLSMDDGFSDMTWTTVHQDSRGFMWMGTNYGLNRYDGYEVSVFTHEANGLQANRIAALAEDANGLLWIGYPKLYILEGGGAKYIDIFNISTEQVQPLQEAIPNLPFKVEDVVLMRNSKIDKSSILFGTIDGRLYKYEEKEFQLIYTHHEKRPINNLMESPDKFFWLKIGQSTKDHDLYAVNFEGKVIDEVRLEEYTDEQDEFFLLKGFLNDGSLIIAQDYRIFAKKIGNPPKQITIREPHETKIEFVQNLKQIWLWEKEKTPPHSERPIIHIYDYNLNLIQTIASPFILLEEYCTNIEAQDKHGGIWFGGDRNKEAHVLYLKKPLFTKECTEDSIGAFRARQLIETKEQKIYFTGTVRNRKSKKSKLSNFGTYLYSGFGLLEDHNGEIWKTRENATLYKVKEEIRIGSADQILAEYQHSDSLAKGIIMMWSLYEDVNNKIWIGHNQGLSYLSKEENELKLFKQHNGFDQINKGAIFHFHENEAGIWLASQTGLYLLDLEKGIIDRFSKEQKGDNYLPHTIFAHIHEDANGIFWLASKGGGLVKWNPKTKVSESFTTKDGLSHNVVYAVYEDDVENLWMSSDRGIMRFNKNTKVVSTYLPRDGISQEEFNTMSHLQTKNGRIFFGGQAGITHFDPKDFQLREQEKDIFLQISEVLRRNEDSGNFEKITSTIIESQELVIAPDEKTFQIKLALLDFQNAKKNQYAYKIEGLDKNWTHSNNPVISINNLPYGNYTFVAKAQGSGGMWVKNQIRIKLHVLKPFYLQLWFIMLCILILCLAIILFIRYNTQKLRKRQVELEQEVFKRTAQIKHDKQIIEEQAKDLKALDEVKSRFFANISHELRTPLTLILGPLSQIMKLPTISKETVDKPLNLMARNGKNLMRLIEEILDLSKLDADKLEVYEAPIPLQKFTRRVFTAFEAQADYLGIQNVFDYRLNEELYVSLDSNKVEKILNNLLSNALKFSSRGQTVSILIQEIPKELLIQVIDQGKGIHPKDLPHVFDRFYQSKVAGANVQGGTGIGLALSKELALLLGGQLSATSTLGQGTTFSLRLPKKVVSATDQLLHTEIENNDITIIEEHQLDDLPNHFKILIVEDNDDMRDFLVEILGERYTCAAVGNGLKALEYLDKNPNTIDLIVSDLMMPEMDGFELLKRVKNSDTLRKIPVILLTARADQKDKLKGLTIGVDSYLTKPFISEELIAQVGNTLFNYNQRKNWQSESSNSSKIIEEKKEETVKEEKYASTDLLSLEDQNWIKEVETCVNKNLANNKFNATQLHLEMNMPEHTFRRYLKRITGMTPVKYIRELRLQEARSLLEMKRYNSVQQVCLAVGFTTTHYFSKHFKIRFGKLPKDYFS